SGIIVRSLRRRPRGDEVVMRLGVLHGTHLPSTVADVQSGAAAAARAGFASYWVPNGFKLDALTAIAAVGRDAEIELGTAIAPIYRLHPVAMAQAAMTVQGATGNRLCLGLGLSHQFV